MPIRTLLRRAARRTHALPCLLLLAVLLRALIPVGYMPDPAALRQGMFRMSLCSAGGAMSHMDMPGMSDSDPSGHAGHMMHTVGDMASHAPDSGEHSAGTECPFWAAAHVALDLPPVIIEPVLATPRDAVIRFEVPASLPPLPPAGPPLGPRAPPFA
ncbi:DUF2946 family protein [Bordetella sp. LUAb4]|uniref:DUF2946 family protein n=1 Tax=Bordetella sp. LUAb4 TaxID=2843195 RepID=UPI001E32E79D|nr:DUF2946 family protein [Bordetella sp. LUAb4]